MSAYDDLMAYQRTTEALGQISGRLAWDQETVMPRGAAPQRADEMAALEGVLHARRTDPRLGDWLSAAEAADDVQAANLREIQRSYDRATKIPGDLASALAKAASIGQGKWAEARAAEDVPAFLPYVKELVALRREEAAAVAGDGDAYDGLLDAYEPGATGAELETMFAALRHRLVDLRAAILEKPPIAGLDGTFPEAEQLALSARLAEVFGYDMDRGRIDKAVHPFSAGSGRDVRITTRTDEADPFNCFYSTIHEVGHASYEQGIAEIHGLTPLGRGVSMGVHESQSRIYENQLGRSRAFTGWLFGAMTESFGRSPAADAETFYAAVNRVQKGYIRTEADEVQYNLHILLRFDLERALIAGDLQPADLEAAWNDRFEADFGYAVDTPSNGCLQDVHWSVGLFGYFPTYTLGNVYAGCLYEGLTQAVPDLHDQMSVGDLGAATGWLRERLHQFGGLRAPQDTIAFAAGSAPTVEPLLRYLEDKFGALYGL